MHELIEGRLWIGNASDIRGASKQLIDLGVQAIVDIAYEEPPASTLARTLIYHRVPLIDSADNLVVQMRLAVLSTVELLKARVPTVVCCSMGMSRSPTVATVAYAIGNQMSAKDARTELLAEMHLDIAPGFWFSVVESCDDLLARP